MNPVSLTSLFEAIGLPYGITLPLFVLGMFTLLILPVIFRPGARAESVAYASYCYLCQMLGILLMTSGALPALYAVFAQRPLAEPTYLGLLIVFLVGGALLLWHDSKLRKIDDASKAIPAALFFMTWKFIGMLVILFSGISLALRLLDPMSQDGDWWVIHLIMILYGLVISWFTLRPTMPGFSSTPVIKSPAPAAPKKLIASKSKTKK